MQRHVLLHVIGTDDPSSAWASLIRRFLQHADHGGAE